MAFRSLPEAPILYIQLSRHIFIYESLNCYLSYEFINIFSFFRIWDCTFAFVLFYIVRWVHINQCAWEHWKFMFESFIFLSLCHKVVVRYLLFILRESACTFFFFGDYFWMRYYYVFYEIGMLMQITLHFLDDRFN